MCKIDGEIIMILFVISLPKTKSLMPYMGNIGDNILLDLFILSLFKMDSFNNLIDDK